MRSQIKSLKLKIRFFIGSLIYIRYMILGAFYSYYRGRIERAFSPPKVKHDFIPIGDLIKAEKTERGANFYFDHAELEIAFLTEDFVRINWQPGLQPIPYSIARNEWPKIEVYFTQEHTCFFWLVIS